MNAQEQSNDFFERPFFAVGLSEKLMPVEMPVGAQAKQIAFSVFSVAAPGRKVVLVQRRVENESWRLAFSL